MAAHGFATRPFFHADLRGSSRWNNREPVREMRDSRQERHLAPQDTGVRVLDVLAPEGLELVGDGRNCAAPDTLTIPPAFLRPFEDVVGCKCAKFDVLFNMFYEHATNPKLRQVNAACGKYDRIQPHGALFYVGFADGNWTNNRGSLLAFDKAVFLHELGHMCLHHAETPDPTQRDPALAFGALHEAFADCFCYYAHLKEAVEARAGPPPAAEPPYYTDPVIDTMQKLCQKLAILDRDPRNAPDVQSDPGTKVHDASRYLTGRILHGVLPGDCQNDAAWSGGLLKLCNRLRRIFAFVRDLDDSNTMTHNAVHNMVRDVVGCAPPDANRGRAAAAAAAQRRPAAPNAGARAPRRGGPCAGCNIA